MGARQPRRRERGDHRALDGQARRPRHDRARDQGGVQARPQGADGRERPHRDRGIAAPPADRSHRPALHAPRRRGHAARGDARRARRTGARGQGPPRRGLQRLARAPRGGACRPASARGSCATSPCSRTTTSSSAATSTAWPTSAGATTSAACRTSRWPRASSRASTAQAPTRFAASAPRAPAPISTSAASACWRPRRGGRRARRPGRGGEPRLAGGAADRRLPDRQRPHAGAARRAHGDDRPRAERRRAARAGRAPRPEAARVESAVAQDRRALGQHRDLGGGEDLVLGARAGAQAREAERAVGAGQHHVARAPARDHRARRDEHDLGEGVEQRGRLAARGAPRRRVDEVHEVHAAGAQDAAHLVLVLDGRQVGGDDGAREGVGHHHVGAARGVPASSSRPSPSRTRSPGSARRSSTVPSARRTAGSLS